MTSPFYPKLNELTISHSSLQTLHSCPRKLEFRKFYPNARRDESSHAADCGTSLHAAYQTWLASGKNLNTALIELMYTWPLRDRDYDRTIQAGYAAIIAMTRSDIAKNYQLAQIMVADGDENRTTARPCIEVPFEIQITNFSLDSSGRVPVIYRGYIDLVLYNPETDTYLIVDIKTHRQNIDRAAQYQFDEQCLPYSIVLERLLGKPLTNITYGYLDVYIDVMNPRINYLPFTKNQEDIHDWARGFANDLINLKNYYQSGWFPRRSSSCISYNRVCSFFDICGMRDHTRLAKMLELLNAEPGGKQLPPWKPWASVELDLGLTA